MITPRFLLRYLLAMMSLRRVIPALLALLFLAAPAHAAVTLGTNSGFVSTAPTTDPGGSEFLPGSTPWTQPSTAPTGITYVSEIGVWMNRAWSGTIDLGIYATGGGVPTTLLHVVRDVSCSSGSAAWCRATGLALTGLSAGTVYNVGMALGVDAYSQYSGAAGDTHLDTDAGGVLEDPFGYKQSSGGTVIALYAVYSTGTPPSTTTLPVLMRQYRQRRQ